MKTVELKRVNITLPTATLRSIDRITKRGNRSRFIDQAVSFYVAEKGRKKMRDRIAEGARVNAERDRVLAVEWFNLDEEAWRDRGQ